MKCGSILPDCCTFNELVAWNFSSSELPGSPRGLRPSVVSTLSGLTSSLCVLFLSLSWTFQKQLAADEVLGRHLVSLMHLDKTTDGVELTEVVCVRLADSCSVCVCVCVNYIWLQLVFVCTTSACLCTCVWAQVFISRVCVCVCSCHGPVRSEYPEDTVSQDWFSLSRSVEAFL